MKTFPLVYSILRSLMVLSLILSLASCTKEDEEPQGAENALGKSFNLVLDEISSSLAYSIMVSSDGTKVLAGTTANGRTYYYSGNGGTTFTPLPENIYLADSKAIDNQGNILLKNNRVFRNGTAESVNSTDEIIIGDNGKLFSYNANSGVIKYKNIADASFTPVTMPITPTPGSGGSTYYAVKASGKGLLFLDVTGSDTKTVKAYLLDEASLQWANYTLAFSTASINNCANPGRFERYTYAGSNTIIVKGCSSLALLNLTTNSTTYIAYPAIEGLVDTDLRDNSIAMDSKGQLYIALRTYADLTTASLYRYSADAWQRVDDFVVMANAVFASDQVGNIYYNTSQGAGQSAKGAIKVSVDSNNKTAFDLPKEPTQIPDATAVSNSRLLVVAENQLFDYDASADKLTRLELKNVNHINILSDGRWIAGGTDHLYLSTDEGQHWAETKKLFSSIDASKNGMAVTQSRIVDGKLLIVGTYAYFYDNLSLGIRQAKYDNMVIEFSSQSSKLNYQFPSDFVPTGIAPDGKLYGYSFFVNGFETSKDHYVIEPAQSPVMLKQGIGLSPFVITEGNVQMTVDNKKDGSGFEVVTRNTATEDWKTSNTSLPGGVGSYDGLKLKQSGDRLVFIRQTEVHVSGN